MILQYREDVNELNELARHQPHRTLAAGIRHENHQLKELQVENNELKTALEEHQNVLELVMTKYRQQVDALVQQGSRKAQATLSHKECNQVSINTILRWWNFFYVVAQINLIYSCLRR